MAAPQKLYLTAPADSFAPPSDGVAVSGANTYYSKVFGAKNSDGQSIHLEWSGTPTGTLTLWCSDKPNPDEASDTDWVQDTSFTPSNPAGAAGKMLDSAGNMKSNLKRVKYVNSAGAGVLFGWATVTRS
jgi:hypothetical protein